MGYIVEVLGAHVASNEMQCGERQEVNTNLRNPEIGLGKGLTREARWCVIACAKWLLPMHS